MGKRTVRDVQKHKLRTRNDSGHAFFYRIVILEATAKKGEIYNGKVRPRTLGIHFVRKQ